MSKLASFTSVPTIVVLPAGDFAKPKWRAMLPASVHARIDVATSRLRDPLKGGGRLVIHGHAKGEEDLVVALVPDNREMFTLLEFARDTLKQALHPSMKTARLVLAAGKLDDSLADAFGAALTARVFAMPVFGRREKDVKPWLLERLELVSASKKSLEAFNYGSATADGTNIARFLATLPPNYLHPKNYGERIKALAKKHGLTAKLHTKDELRKMGAGAFTAVDQGDPDSQGGIWEVTYAPKAKAKRTVHLVGKGMCFDTGGYDIKVSGNMHTMKGDMQGSAVALATLVSAATLKLPIAMKAFLAVTENHISPKAYKADEVVTALNGITIEIINTDAEGRMVLADAYTLASRGKPDAVIGFATLTGSAVRSIGTKYSCAFTNRDQLHEPIKAAGQKSGERIWTFPIGGVFNKPLESKVADTLQCVKSPGPDHIYAATFLSKFVEQGPAWVHVDLSASENSDGIAHVDSMFSGFGVRWAVEFMNKAAL